MNVDKHTRTKAQRQPPIAGLIRAGALIRDDRRPPARPLPWGDA